MVPGLDGQKMSKSYDNTLPLFEAEKPLRKRIMGMKTDSTPVEAPKPAGSPLLALLVLLCEADEAAEHKRTWAEGGVGYGSYKKRLFERYLEVFGPARARRAELEADPEAVAEILNAGAAKARALAAPIWEQVVEATGVGGRIGAMERGAEALIR